MYAHPMLQITYPLTPRQNLGKEQIEELHDDIERYLTLEESKTNIDFWTVCC